MIFRCKTSFESREGSHAYTFDEGSVWMARLARPAEGGYELVNMCELIDGDTTGLEVPIRSCYLSSHFDPVPADSCVPSFMIRTTGVVL